MFSKIVSLAEFLPGNIKKNPSDRTTHLQLRSYSNTQFFSI